MTKGIMLAGHGSTQAFNKGVMDMQAQLLRDKGLENVYVGFNEFSFPTIRDAVEDMVADGIDEILVVPFFVASGLHVTRDIPMKHFGLPRNSTGGDVEISGKKVSVKIESAFGDDPNLTDILLERIEELKTPGRKLGILVMGHGSRLDFNSDVVSLNAQRIRDRGYTDVRVGYNEFNEPKIEDSIKEMIRDGLDEIIALPLFISLGKHLTMDVPMKLGMETYSDCADVTVDGHTATVKYAYPVGSDPRLSDVLVEKIRKAGW